jgi:pyridoxine kinase
MAKVLAISSHVVRGHVGLDATVPALQHLGHEVWSLPTVVLASRPGLGRPIKHELPAEALGAMLAALEADGCWASLGAVFAGYFPSAKGVLAAAGAIASIKATRADVPVLIDPIIGDAGRLYVARPTAEAIRDVLLPLATIATPNLFELSWLTGCDLQASADAAACARRLGPPMVVVTSVRQTGRMVATVLVGKDQCIEREMGRRADVPNGAGDLFAGLLLGHLLKGCTSEAALDASLADLDRVLAASAGREVLELAALEQGLGAQARNPGSAAGQATGATGGQC